MGKTSCRVFSPVCREKKSLPEFLDRYKEAPGLAMHWVLMGPNSRKTRPHTGGVMRDYSQCRKMPSAVVKSITNTYYLANVAGNPHTFEYRCVQMRSPISLYFRLLPLHPNRKWQWKSPKHNFVVYLSGKCVHHGDER